MPLNDQTEYLPADVPSLDEILAEIARREEEDGLARERKLYNWHLNGRKEQQAPEGPWSTWLALSGRGWGKTEAGAQWVRERVQAGARSIAIVAETQKDLEEVMVPRLIRVHPPSEAPVARYRPVRITWPNGAIALGYNGTEPDQLRGPEFDTAWVDELAKYRYAQDLWDMLQFTMRRPDPRVFITTTPRPLPIIRSIIAEKSTIVTRGNTLDNAANLPPEYIARLKERYAGTRLGRQELNAEILDDIPNALWTRDMIDAARKSVGRPDHQRVVVAVDPSGARNADDEGADNIGIVVAALGTDGRGYVLADRSCKLSPAGWGRRAVDAYHEFKADRIVAERNFGGAMVEHVIRVADHRVAFEEVTASRGKIVRAEPISAFYEQNKVSHVGAGLESLEDQMCQMTSEGYFGDGSPDRVDALVWALSLLMERGPPMVISAEVMRRAGVHPGAMRGF